MKVVEMFAGIGSQAKALSRIASKNNINIDIVKTCEWNVHAFVAYDLIHNSNKINISVNKLNKEEILEKLSTYTLSSNGIVPMSFKQLKAYNEILLKRIYSSILKNNNLINVKEVKGTDIPDDIDLLTYSFPCQDLSNVGSLHGYKHGIDRDKNTRSGLLWEIERILEEKVDLNTSLPRFLLLENVTALEAKRHKGNFEQWQNKLSEMGYVNKVYKLNAEDFGIPQYRKRIFMLSVFVGNNKLNEQITNEYFTTHDLNDNKYIESLSIIRKPLKSFLKLNYSKSIFFNEALESQPNNTKSRLKIWKENSKIVNEENKIAKRVQTITTKQDRHPNSGNIYFNINNQKSQYRFLTPRECFVLMGFHEKDFNVLIDNNINTRGKSMFFSRDILNKLAGNSIVVDVLEHVFNQMLEIRELLITNSNYDLISSEENLSIKSF